MLSRILPQTASSNPRRRVTNRGRILELCRSALYIAYWFLSGMLMLWLPWTSIWENNYFLYFHPELRPVVCNPYFKGGVFGLGIVNLTLGFEELLGVLNLLHRQPSA
jgi:hypothetical protein